MQCHTATIVGLIMDPLLAHSGMGSVGNVSHMQGRGAHPVNRCTSIYADEESFSTGLVGDT